MITKEQYLEAKKLTVEYEHEQLNKPIVSGSWRLIKCKLKLKTMIKETDLRIGNVIYYQSSEDGLLPNRVDWQYLRWLSEQPESFNETFKPIPINWVVLGKLGWWVEDNGDHAFLQKQVGEWGIFVIDSDGNGLSYCSRNASISKKIEYYHELQNVFFSTTGVELDCKIDDLEVSKLVEHILSDGYNGEDMPF